MRICRYTMLNMGQKITSENFHRSKDHQNNSFSEKWLYHLLSVREKSLSSNFHPISGYRSRVINTSLSMGINMAHRLPMLILPCYNISKISLFWAEISYGPRGPGSPEVL